MIRLADVGDLGKVLVDADGYTLYLFEPDNRSRSTCTGLCLAEWPPLVVPFGEHPPSAGPGVNSALIGTIPAPNGEQVTYNGWPLYLWVADTSPGEATGEGVSNFGGPWYALDSSGNAVIARKGL